jgi:hypothetical protein
MPQTIDAEIFLIVDSIGDTAVGTSEEDARERYEETIQPLSDASGFRLVKLVVKVPLPEVAELVGEVPTHGTACLTLTAV